ncbi:MAG: ribonuclease HII [Bacilli bacterium]|nr:ribonuclease HII [Bacilli bacterium]MDD3305052.1 ribonuclease HII [Bacilli bacterium]MDD4053477.1 ribonuclease HII [Bacilli bacterium]MDD4411512.1 ribonuclease HII [Bacilli bacterium]
MEDLYKYEHELNDQGIEYIAGIDEVGRGPLVGPVVCACVVLPKDFKLLGLTDSKKLSSKKRDLFFDIIKEQALGIGIGVIDEKRIDEVNIYQATKEGMIAALNEVECKVEHVLIDAMKLNINLPSTSIIKGDTKSISIAAASVIAKVTRDRMMEELDLKYPIYGFKRNKGYPTKEHLNAIDEYGVIENHRKSYKPVMDAILKGEIKKNADKNVNSGLFTN